MVIIKKILSAAICLSLTAALLMPVTASEQLILNQEQSVTITNLSGSFFTFVPTQDGYYRYYSFGCGEGDPYGFITDAIHNTLASGNDIGGDDRNFEIVCYLEAGQTYYLAATTYIGSADYQIRIQKLADPTSIQFQTPSVTGQISQSRYLELTFQPANCALNGVTFRSSAPDVVQVDGDGRVYFMRPGTATITASTYNGLTATCTVTTAAPASLRLNGAAQLDASLGTQYLSFTAPNAGWFGCQSEGHIIDPYLSVLDEQFNELARDDDSVDGRNFFAPFYLQAGQQCYLAIEHYDSVGKGIVTLRALSAPEAITLREDRLVGYPGSYCQLTPLYAPQASIPEALTWSSGNEAVATVDEYGYVIFRAPGTTAIGFTSATGKTDTVTVTVQSAPTGNTLVASGICGATLRWKLDTSGLLTISGTGEMFDHYDHWHSYAQQITQVSLPQGITSIGSGAFAWCKSLTQISIPSGVQRIGSGAFMGCSALNKVTLPSSLTHIDYDAFHSCTALKDITLPHGLSHLGQAAFAHCPALTEMDLPSGLVRLSANCFSQCSSLSRVTLPPELLCIHDRAFEGTALAGTLRIPDTVAYIGNAAFSDSQLSGLQFPGNAPTFGPDALSGLNVWAIYSMNDATWTADSLKSYGGTVTWLGEAFLSGGVTASEGALVTAALYTPGSSTPIQSVTVQDGSYTFSGIRSGSYILTVSAEHHVPRSVEVQVTGASGPDVTICLLGDVTGDGRLNVGDVARIYGHARRTSLLEDDYRISCADITGDKRINVGDAARLYAHVKKTSPMF